MAYIKKLFNDNFLQYASYVIKDRAIPDLDDGLKPVQRRILHSLFEMDDGKFHKVANVVGHCMKYHPHGDASIYSALVVLANKEFFIDKQGNFGNLYTGDEASAARYIECRANQMAKDIFYKPAITEYADSYDGRNREPVAFPAKVPVILAMGAEGIAVGMSTKILPHNMIEVLKAEIASLRGKRFKLFPDFPTSGMIDVSGYEDGAGKVLVRARLDISDPKRVVIREIPFGSTTESIIASIENASRAGRIKIAGISDFTTENVEIEVKLARGEYAQDTVDALYAFTDCEQSISCNLLVIKDDLPTQMTVTEVVNYHAQKLLGVLKAELKLEKGELLDKLHARTLERIFIEERIYKLIEQQKTEEGVINAVFKGLKPFAKEIAREVTKEDIDRLLKIPIRRISLYDINKARAEMDEIKARIKEIEKHLKNLIDYAVGFLESIMKRMEKLCPRKSEVVSFSKVDVKEVAKRNLPLRYDAVSGYIGTAVSGGQDILTVSTFDRIFLIRRNGSYTVVDVPEKFFVDKGLLYCGLAEKEELSGVEFTYIYKEKENGFPYIKRCQVEGFILNKDYFPLPDEAEVLAFETRPVFRFTVDYVKKPRMKVKSENFTTKDYPIKGLKAQGVRLASKEAESVAVQSKDGPGLFDVPKGDARSKVSAEKKAEAINPPKAKAKPPAAKKPVGRPPSASKSKAKSAAKARPAIKKKKS
jgi:topoisomerase IV subunit A